jgi:hypothetical protein
MALSAAASPSCPNHSTPPEECPTVVCQASLYVAAEASETPVLEQWLTETALLPARLAPARTQVAPSSAAAASSRVYLRTHSLLI